MKTPILFIEDIHNGTRKLHSTTLGVTSGCYVSISEEDLWYNFARD